MEKEQEELKAPEFGELSGGHCWHEDKEVKTEGPGFTCCNCGHHAGYAKYYKKDYKGHGPFYPDAELAGEAWQFKYIDNCPFVCILASPNIKSKYY